MAPHIRSHRAPCSCFPKKVSLQPSSEHKTIADVSVTGQDFASRWSRFVFYVFVFLCVVSIRPSPAGGITVTTKPFKFRNDVDIVGPEGSSKLCF